MAAVNSDLTVQLPDEVLCHVFSFLGLKDRLQSEAVNHKFQRCVLEELNVKPQPLELEFFKYDRTMNGHNLPRRMGSGPLLALAKKAKFSSISVRIPYDGIGLEAMERLDWVLLALLLTENQCLSKVTAFESNAGCNQDIMEKFFDKCDKLSTIKLDFGICPLNSELFGQYTIYPLDLDKLLKNRRLTELTLRPFGFNQEGLADMFWVIKQNTLKKVVLWFREMPELNMDELVNALNIGGSALEEIHFLFGEVDVQLTDLFESLARLPSLRKCEIECYFPEPTNQNQFVDVMTSLFNMSDINITVNATPYSFFTGLPGCQIVAMIHQIQDVHHDLVVDFDHDRSLILSLGNASVTTSFFNEEVEDCGAEDCVDCQSFYPSLLTLLRLRAREAVLDAVEAQHLPHWQLDRCRMDKFLDDLSLGLWGVFANYWRPLSVEANEDQQSVTITFETVAMQHQLFSITIGCGHCLTNRCIKCGD